MITFSPIRALGIPVRFSARRKKIIPPEITTIESASGQELTQTTYSSGAKLYKVNRPEVNLNGIPEQEEPEDNDTERKPDPAYALCDFSNKFAESIINDDRYNLDKTKRLSPGNLETFNYFLNAVVPSPIGNETLNNLCSIVQFVPEEEGYNIVKTILKKRYRSRASSNNSICQKLANTNLKTEDAYNAYKLIENSINTSHKSANFAIRSINNNRIRTYRKEYNDDQKMEVFKEYIGKLMPQYIYKYNLALGGFLDSLQYFKKDTYRVEAAKYAISKFSFDLDPDPDNRGSILTATKEMRDPINYYIDDGDDKDELHESLRVINQNAAVLMDNAAFIENLTENKNLYASSFEDIIDQLITSPSGNKVLLKFCAPLADPEVTIPEEEELNIIEKITDKLDKESTEGAEENNEVCRLLAGKVSPANKEEAYKLIRESINPNHESADEVRKALV